MVVTISEESTWLIVTMLVFLIMAAILIGYFVSQGPEGFGYQFLRRMFYDFMYFFGGPRIVEI